MLYACDTADRYNRNECDLCAVLPLRILEFYIERTRTVLVFLHVAYANCVKSFAHKFLNGTSIISDLFFRGSQLHRFAPNVYESLCVKESVQISRYLITIIFFGRTNASIDSRKTTKNWNGHNFVDK